MHLLGCANGFMEARVLAASIDRKRVLAGPTRSLVKEITRCHLQTRNDSRRESVALICPDPASLDGVSAEFSPRA